MYTIFHCFFICNGKSFGASKDENDIMHNKWKWIIDLRAQCTLNKSRKIVWNKIATFESEKFWNSNRFSKIFSKPFLMYLLTGMVNSQWAPTHHHNKNYLILAMVLFPLDHDLAWSIWILKLMYIVLVSIKSCIHENTRHWTLEFFIHESNWELLTEFFEFFGWEWVSMKCIRSYCNLTSLYTQMHKDFSIIF